MRADRHRGDKNRWHRQAKGKGALTPHGRNRGGKHHQEVNLTTVLRLAAEAVATSWCNSSEDTPPGSSAFSCTLKTWTPCSMAILKSGIANPEIWSVMHTLAFFLSTTGAAEIPGVWRKWADQPPSRGGAKSFPVWRSSNVLAWRTSISADLRPGLANKHLSGLAHCKWII